MIPKKIHFIWLGNNSYPSLVERCMESWKKYCPDYEIITWDDEKCREMISENKFASQAYNDKMYAYTSDYIRLKVLDQFGGIYCDADCEILRPIDDLLKSNFIGFQDPTHIGTAIMGGKNCQYFRALLDEYNTREYRRDSLETNVRHMTSLAVNHGAVLNNKQQHVMDIDIYPTEILSPYHPKYGGEVTKNSYAVHHFNGSWVESYKIAKKRRKKIRKVIIAGVVLVALLCFFLWLTA